MEVDATLAPDDHNWISSVAQNQLNIQKIELDNLINLEKDLGVAEKVALIIK